MRRWCVMAGCGHRVCRHPSEPRDRSDFGAGPPSRSGPATLTRRYIDEGDNPDRFTDDVFRSSLIANQASKGKVQAIG